MAQRAYVQPQAIIQKLRHDGPNVETLSGNKTLTVTDAQLQFLDPQTGATRRVEMPDVAASAGCFYWIENTNTSTGVIEVWDDGQSNKLGDLKAGYRAAVVSDGTTWRISISTRTGATISGMDATIASTGWTEDSAAAPPGNHYYYADINHNLDKRYLHVQCADTDTHQQIIPMEIYYTDSNNLRIWMANLQPNLMVMISG